MWWVSFVTIGGGGGGGGGGGDAEQGIKRRAEKNRRVNKM